MLRVVVYHWFLPVERSILQLDPLVTDLNIVLLIFNVEQD